MFVQLDDKSLPLKQDSPEIRSPLVINESVVHTFKYWHKGIRPGIRYHNKLYAHVQSYPVNERLKAYAIAYELTERGDTICITVSKTHYSIWISLQSLSRARDESSLL